MQVLKADTQVKVVIGPAVAIGDGYTMTTALNIATADSATIVKHDNSTVVDISGDTWAALTNADGFYHLTLQAGDLDTEGHFTVCIEDVSLCLPVMARFQVVNANVYDSLFAAATTDYLQVDTLQLGGGTQSATDLKDFADAGYDPGTNKVQGVVLTDTCTTNTDVRGTDSAALASVCTEGRLAELDAGNLPTDIAAIPTTAMRGTDSAALASVCTEGRLAELDAGNLPTDIAAIPTTAMRGTDSAALATVCTEGRLAELDAGNLPTDIAAIPTTAMRGTDSAATEAKQDTMQTAVDAIPTTAMRGTDNAATAAALSTHDGKLDTVDTNVDAIQVITDALTAAAAAKLATSAGTMLTGIVSWDNTNATTTVIYSSDITEATADHFNGRYMLFTSGALLYQATDITDYALDTGEGKFTVTAVTEAPADDSTFIII